jgi:nucleoside-diphosphate-sugar epimerase
VRDSDFAKHLDGIDIVYHFAGISALPECESKSQKCIEVNVAAVANVLGAVRTSKVKRVIFASTSAVYENNPKDEVHKETDPRLPKPYLRNKQILRQTNVQVLR